MRDASGMIGRTEARAASFLSAYVESLILTGKCLHPSPRTYVRVPKVLNSLRVGCGRPSGRVMRSHPLRVPLLGSRVSSRASRRRLEWINPLSLWSSHVSSSPFSRVPPGLRKRGLLFGVLKAKRYYRLDSSSL